MRMIDAGINYYEFKYREADYGAYPKGLMYYLTMMDSWLYDENKPFIHIEAGKTFEQIKKEKESGLFEKIIEEWLVNNHHGSVISLVPKRNLEKELEDKTKSELADFKSKLTKEQIQQYVRETKELKEYQDEPSSQENLEKFQCSHSKILEKLRQDFISMKKRKMVSRLFTIICLPTELHIL